MIIDKPLSDRIGGTKGGGGGKNGVNNTKGLFRQWKTRLQRPLTHESKLMNSQMRLSAS